MDECPDYHIQVYRNAAGQIHRDDDLPAWVDIRGGIQEWFYEGKRHRGGDKPAVIRVHQGAGVTPEIVHQEWFRHGVRHREGDQPAFLEKKTFTPFLSCQVESYKEVYHKYCWFQNGAMHRENGHPAFFVFRNRVLAQRSWYRNGYRIKAAGVCRWLVRRRVCPIKTTVERCLAAYVNGDLVRACLEYMAE